MPIRGNIERLDARQISGWIHLPGNEADKPVLEVVLDGTVVAEARADGARRDLKEAGLGEGACEFVIALPDHLGEQLPKLQLRIKDTDLYLTHPSRFGTEHPAPQQMPKGLKVFISGPARSGTSIVFHALQQIFGLPGTGEGHVLPIYQSTLFKFYEYANNFSTDSGVLASHLDYNGFKARVYQDVQALYSRLFPGGSFVDKTPSHEAIEALRIAIEAFPDCKIILMTRNGIEVVDSFIRKFSAGFEEACAEWRDSMRAIRLLREEHGSVLVLDQFSLRNSSLKASRNLANHLNSPEKFGALELFFAENEVERTATNVPNSPLSINQTNWTADQSKLFLDICGLEMIENGYDL